MNENNNSRNSGLFTILGLVLVYLFFRAFFPSVSKMVLFFVTFAFVAIFVLVVALLIVSTRSKSDGDEEAALDEESAQVVKTANSNVLALRSRVARIKNQEIRAGGNAICEEADRIVGALRKDPKHISTARQFWNYYLPSLGTILTKYEKIEKSGVPDEKITEKVGAYLKDIKLALEKLYKSFFDDDKLDMSVEMEAMKLAMQRDGLLTSEDADLKEPEKELTF